MKIKYRSTMHAVAFPDEDGAYTMQMLLDKADVYMYENKQLCKKRKI